MKIDIAELPKLRDNLDALAADLATHAAITALPEDVQTFKVMKHGLFVTEISRDELLAVMQGRIDATSRYINQRYQLDFLKANANAVPVAAIDVTRAMAEGEQA